MCFDPDSHPPVAPVAGAAVSHEDLVLESADGTRFAASAAVPDVVFDYFGRTAGAHKRDGDFEYMPHVAQVIAAGVEHEVVTYPGAPHSFFDRKQEAFADESADAWERTLAFLERHG